VIRMRMPVKSSRATARFVPFAFATITLLMQWFTSLANRDSLPESFLSFRFADRVPFSWSFVRSLRWRWRTLFTFPEEWTVPSESTAMFLMPRSIPRTPVVSAFAGTSASQVT